MCALGQEGLNAFAACPHLAVLALDKTGSKARVEVSAEQARILGGIHLGNERVLL